MISGSGTVEVVSQWPDGGSMRFNATAATSGAQLTFNFTCGGAGTASLGYSATATQLTIFGAANSLGVYTKQ